MARLNLLETSQTGPVGAPEPNLEYENRPEWFRNWEKTGLLAFEDKNGDCRISYYKDSPLYTSPSPRDMQKTPMPSAAPTKKVY